MVEPVIEVERLRKVYAEGAETVEAVRDASLRVAPGEVVAIMGPSGSGKTTLLSMMGCLLRPTSGRIVIAGREVQALPERDLPAIRQLHVGFIFQSFNLFAALTARENVQVALEIKGVKGMEARREAEALLQRVGLGDRMRFLPRDLSGGQKQRVSIARALAGRPPLILADEPTGNLDSRTGHQVVALLRELAREKRSAVVVVTHDTRLADVADHICHLEDGVLTGAGNA
ncbi:MAG: ABC transporter ATP-binding protein [Nitrospirae bacterium]|nr:ABC transporter ATP-binding protein [Nitrospirota bacterium]